MAAGALHRRGAGGFTLIELAVVLFVVALLLGGLLAPLAVRVEQNARNDTERALEEIREALYGFAVVNGRLPCPDCAGAAGGCGAVPAAQRNDGVEDRTGAPAACAADAAGFATGNLPWADLGVPERDAWDRFFAYGVTSTFADDVDGTGCSGSPRAGVSFELCSNGNATIRSAAGAPGSDLVTGAPAIVIAYGANGGSCPNSPHEIENWVENRDNPIPACGLAAADSIFVRKIFSREGAEEFDDLLTWLPAPVLMNRMVVAGRLP